MDGEDLKRRLGPVTVGRQIRASIEALRQGQHAVPGDAAECRRAALAAASAMPEPAFPRQPRMEGARRR